MACPAPSLCAVVDNTGHAYTWRNGTWLTPQSFSQFLGFGTAASRVSLYQSGRVGVSCPTVTDCTAVVGTAVLDWNGVAWSEEATPWTTSLAPGSGVPVSIACPTTNLCAIVNGDAIVVRDGNKPWTPRQTLDPGRQIDAISCPSRSFCVTVDDAGAIMLWNGTTWTGPTQVVPAANQYPGVGGSVSCPNAQFCMVMNADGDYATYNGAAAGDRVRDAGSGPARWSRGGAPHPPRGSVMSRPARPARAVTVLQLRVVATTPVRRSKKALLSLVTP